MSLLRNFLRSDRKCLWKFTYNLGWKGMSGFSKFEKRKKKGEVFPCFQFISVTDDCNLTCQGCWVTKGEKSESIDIQSINKIITESKKYGSYFFKGCDNLNTANKTKRCTLETPDSFLI